MNIDVNVNSVYYVLHGATHSFLWLEPRLNYYQFQTTEEPKKLTTAVQRFGEYSEKQKSQQEPSHRQKIEVLLQKSVVLDLSAWFA